MNFGLIKVIRYIYIYGIIRTAVKVAGRMRLAVPIWPILRLFQPLRTGLNIGIIGCGQFSFSSIAYFLSTSTNSKLVWCSDINLSAAKSMAIAYGMKSHDVDCSSFLKETNLVYIASNHSTHTSYAIQCLNAGCDVYIEKPISTTSEQFDDLLTVTKKTKRKIFVGYNRPHAPSLKLIKNNVENKKLPFTMSCFITGHFIPDDHWYRDPKEGTRVCGNLGHWLDLFVNMMFWSEKSVSKLNISITYSDIKTPSDNFSVVICSPQGDLVTLTFSSRSEPFEGVNESINYQQGNLIAKINDHRHTQIWVDQKYISKRHWPKNVGHKHAILQPFNNDHVREWSELIVSTKLMLLVTEMVKNLETSRDCVIDYENIN